jgi:hypothetical protein
MLVLRLCDHVSPLRQGASSWDTSVPHSWLPALSPVTAPAQDCPVAANGTSVLPPSWPRLARCGTERTRTSLLRASSTSAAARGIRTTWRGSAPPSTGGHPVASRGRGERNQRSAAMSVPSRQQLPAACRFRPSSGLPALSAAGADHESRPKLRAIPAGARVSSQGSASPHLRPQTQRGSNPGQQFSMLLKRDSRSRCSRSTQPMAQSISRRRDRRRLAGPRSGRLWRPCKPPQPPRLISWAS